MTTNISVPEPPPLDARITSVTPEREPAPVCAHGVAMDVHCCGCHSGFLFDVQRCTCVVHYSTAATMSDAEEFAHVTTVLRALRARFGVDRVRLAVQELASGEARSK